MHDTRSFHPCLAGPARHGPCRRAGFSAQRQLQRALRADGDGRSLVITDARRARVAVTNLPADVRLRRMGDLLYLDGSDADPLHFRDLCTYPMN